jgi:hypothetical protein
MKMNFPRKVFEMTKTKEGAGEHPKDAVGWMSVQSWSHFVIVGSTKNSSEAGAT